MFDFKAMLKILNYLSQHKKLTALIAIAIGASLGISLAIADVMNIRGILGWTAGLGGVIVLMLHAKSFFSTDDLGPYYSRIYGLGFGLIYTSLVFYLFTFYAGQQNLFFNKVAFSSMLSIALYNFLVNNYAGIEKQHLIAKTMLDKQIEKKEKERLKLEQAKKNEP